MGFPVLIIGESGSGKSASMRNFKAGEIGIINVAKKPLPFKTDLKTFNSDNYEQITNALVKSKLKTMVIDDCQYLMANEYMRSANKTGYQKFTDMALNFWNLTQTVVNDLPGDVLVHFLGHIERDASGNEKFKTIGKLLDEKITIEGLFTVVLKTVVTNRQYMFSTQTNGQDTAKSPMGMFAELLIDNDLKMVDATIRDFYGMNNLPPKVSQSTQTTSTKQSIKVNQDEEDRQ